MESEEINEYESSELKLNHANIKISKLFQNCNVLI